VVVVAMVVAVLVAFMLAVVVWQWWWRMGGDGSESVVVQLCHLQQRPAAICEREETVSTDLGMTLCKL